MKLFYLSSFLPKRSETFVYKEALGLRARGIPVGTGSLYPPEKDLGEKRLDDLAKQTLMVYGEGPYRLLSDALSFSLRHPKRAVAVAGLALGDSLSAADVSWRARPKILVQCLAAMALAQRVELEGYSHLHIHMAHAPATVGMYAAFCLGISFSFTGHAADLFRERCLLEQKLRRAQFVACISQWHREWYSALCPRPDNCYPIVRCGVDIPEEAATLSCAPPFRILGLGRIVPKKGFDLLIGACRILVKKGIPLECVIAGDGPELEKLRRQAEGLPVFFTGAVANCEVPALMAKTDVFALPCRVSEDGDRDGIPVALMEAMAAGVCVVAGDLPTIRELIDSGKNGILIPPNDIDALADCLENLVKDPQFRGALCAAGRQKIEEEFSSSKNLDRILAAFAS
ncbi:MAG: glycosyltransferase family 4 protein [Cyanobacteriota bacterium]|nr:glycosyltransferase family 4 protein [Cyanobacteriota bacterium]